MLNDIKDYKALKKAIVKMYKKHVIEQEGGKKKGKEGDSDINNDKKIERKYLEKSLNNVTGKLTKSSETFVQSNKKIMKENVTLLQMYNNLKIELHELNCVLKNEQNKNIKGRSAFGDATESDEIQMLRQENLKLSEEIANLEQRDAEINDQVRNMSEQAEFSLKMRQQQRQKDD